MPAVKKKEEPKQECKYCFKIVRGVHREGKTYYSAAKIQDGNSDIIHTNTNLLKLNGAGPRQQKFVAASDVVTQEDVQGSDDGLEELSLKELKEMASEGDINVSELKSKKAVIEAIRAAEQE